MQLADWRPPLAVCVSVCVCVLVCSWTVAKGPWELSTNKVLAHDCNTSLETIAYGGGGAFVSTRPYLICQQVLLCWSEFV